MNYKQKTLKNLILLSTLFLYYSCQTEKEHVEQGNQINDFKVEKINFNEFKKRAPKASDKIYEIIFKKSNHNYSRDVVINNDFYVDTDEVIEITKQDKISYTFPICRYNESLLTENLVLTLKDNNYRAKIVTYNISEEEKEAIKNGILIDVSDKISTTNLENGNSIAADVMNRDMNDCTETKIEYKRCCSGEHSSKDVMQGIICYCTTPPTGYTYTIVAVPCEKQDYGGGSPTNPGTTDPEPEPTDPNAPIDNFEDTTLPNLPKTTKPCQDLKTKSSDSEFIEKMTILKNDADNTVESGYVMYKDLPKYSNKQTGGIDNSGTYLDLVYDPNRAATITGFTHCHLNNSTIKNFSVFSLDDLIMFSKLIENSTAPLEELTMFVTSNKGTFALKIKNKAAFINAINSITPLLYDAYDNMFKNKINKDNDTNNQAKGLINFFKASGLSTSETYELYRSDSNFSNWQKLTIDQNNNLIPINC